MINIRRVFLSSRLLAVVAVALAASPSLGASSEAAPGSGNLVRVELRQESFSKPGDAQLVLDRVIIRGLDGQSVAISACADNLQRTILDLASNMIPNVEFTAAYPEDVLLALSQLQQRTPPTTSLGQVLSGGDRSDYPPWLKSNPNETKRITCRLTRVSLLELSCVIAAALDQEVGLLPDGRLVFGSTGKWVVGCVPSFTVRLQTPSGKQ